MIGEAILLVVSITVTGVIGHGAGAESERRRLRRHARQGTPRDLSTLERLIDADRPRRYWQ